MGWDEQGTRSERGGEVEDSRGLIPGPVEHAAAIEVTPGEFRPDAGTLTKIGRRLDKVATLEAADSPLDQRPVVTGISPQHFRPAR